MKIKKNHQRDGVSKPLTSSVCQVTQQPEPIAAKPRADLGSLDPILTTSFIKNENSIVLS